MFIYWLIIVVTLVKIAEFIERNKGNKLIDMNINKRKRNSRPKEIKYL